MSAVEKTSFLQGIKATVSDVEIFQDGDKIGVRRDIEQAIDEETAGSPIADSIKTQRTQLRQSEHETVFDLYDAMIDLDPELSGAVNAISQTASQYSVVPPVDDPDANGKTALEECKILNRKLDGNVMAIDILKNLLRYGNDINKKVYREDEGITGLQSLPINSMTIVDDPEDLTTVDKGTGLINSILNQASADPEELDDQNELNEVFSREAYVLNEGKEDIKPKIIDPTNVLHFDIDARSNWFTDHLNRETYGVWGKSRLEPLKFTIQTKYNTLTNKVAMDDKLLAREIYYIDTTALFGDINDFEKRKSEAKKYAKEIAQMVEGLGPDERPVLPDHVEIDVIGPEGKAIDQQPFIEQLNNAIAAALTFPMAGLGRGTTSVKAGEEISSLWAEKNIWNLRKAVIKGFEEMFRDHLKLRHPDWLMEDDVENPLEGTLREEIQVPTLEYEPFKEADMTERARQIKLLYDTKTASAEERRELFGISTDEESMERLTEEFSAIAEGEQPNRTPTPRAEETNRDPPDEGDETPDEGNTEEGDE